MAVVAVDELTMTYRVPVRASGLTAALGSLVHRRYREVPAVRDASFDVQAGEVVGFIGPNGAGKTTTMKILSGILHHTAGEVSVLGCTPWHRSREFLKRIAFVRGSQPVGGSQELTVLDSLEYQRVLYQVPRWEYDDALAELTELLQLEPLLNRQLRALSLGEKMRVGLALGLIYRPTVLFLDEPTLGLDVSAAAIIRSFIGRYAAESGATVLLTSHYMADVASLCPRLILIDKGRVQYDGGLTALSTRLTPYKLVRLTAPAARFDDFADLAEAVESNDGVWVLRVARDQVAVTTGRLLTRINVADLTVEEPALEDVIDLAYREGVQ
jgi:ABC-type uncharacterized transport system ATPase subunit